MLARMCLIAVAIDAHPRYRLVLAANRDEFHDRPAAPASYWDDAPQVFGGRDLRQHGSWFALSRSGRWAAVTNVRRMVQPDPKAPSRGALVSGFVNGDGPASRYSADIEPQAVRYAGFNLLVGDGAHTLYLTNHPQFRAQRLAPGVHAVSNATLDTPWPKLLRLRGALGQWCAAGRDGFEPLFAALADDRPAADAELPDTGVGIDMERFLSPPFIRGDRYGTRASSLLTITTDGIARFHERRFAASGLPVGETVETFSLS